MLQPAHGREINQQRTFEVNARLLNINIQMLRDAVSPVCQTSRPNAGKPGQP